MDLVEAKSLVAAWAAQERLVRRVFFFGSRIRNEHTMVSDLDIAIELIYPDSDTAVAHWVFESDAWTQKLSQLLPWKLDLQLFNPQGTPSTAEYIARSSIIVYE